MAINKIILVTILSSYITCGIVHGSPRSSQSTVGDTFILPEYEGIWYTVATIYPPRSNPLFSCERFGIRPKNGSNVDYEEIFRTVYSGRPITSRGYGRVFDSKVESVFPGVSLDRNVYSVTKYKNGNEIIIHNDATILYSSLLSRGPIASAESKTAFERIGAAAHVDVTYINHNDCGYSKIPSVSTKISEINACIVN